MNMNESTDEEEDPVVYLKKATNRTWRRGRNFALSARDQSVLRNLGTELSQLTNERRLSTIGVFTVLLHITLLCRSERVPIARLLASERYRMMPCLALILSYNIVKTIRASKVLQEQIDSIVQVTKSQYNLPKLSPKINRTMEDLGSANCRMFTRFTKDELESLFLHLRFPAGQSVILQEHKFTWEEIFLVSLTWIAHGNQFTCMEHQFGGNTNYYGCMVEAFVEHVFSNFYHKIAGDSMRMWAPKINAFRERIWHFVCFEKDDNGHYNLKRPEYDFDLASWRIFGFIDCTDVRCCRPGAGPAGPDGERRENAGDIQRAFYSSYMKAHGLKYQCVTLPNGMFGSVFGTALSHNDRGTLNMSRLQEYLLDLLPPNIGSQEFGFCRAALFGDSIYIPSQVMLRKIINSLHPTDLQFNRDLNSARTSVEHHFCYLFGIFKLLGQKHRFKLLSKKRGINRLHLTIFFLSNCHTCFRGNLVSSRFDMASPSIEEYLPLDENLVQYLDNDEQNDYNAFGPDF